MQPALTHISIRGSQTVQAESESDCRSIELSSQLLGAQLAPFATGKTREAAAAGLGIKRD